jgi:transcriptional regulator with XRE-family HTH domain
MYSSQRKRGVIMAEWTKEVFAKNLRYYLSQSGKTQKEVASAVGVSAPTFHEWCSAKKTPRMDKVERLANYFGILKSDLIEDKQKQPTQSELSYKKREFIKKVEGMTEAQIEKLEQILALVENTEL